MKRKKFTTILTPEDYLDVMLEIERKEIKKFALNYRSLIDGKWQQIYRVDNFHGFLHEQRFWRSKEPIALHENIPIRQVVHKYTDFIVKNFREFKNYFKKKK